MAHTKASLEALASSQNPEDRKKIVTILKDDFGPNSLKMSEIVRLTPEERVDKILGLQAKQGGKPAAGKAATKAAPAAVGKPAAGKKAAVKQTDPEPEVEYDADEASAEEAAPAGASTEELQAVVAEAVAPLAEMLAAIQESLSETQASAQRAEIMAKQAAMAGGFSEEDLDALVSGE